MTQEEYEQKKNEINQKISEYHKAYADLVAAYDENSVEALNKKYKGKYILSYKRKYYQVNDAKQIDENSFTLYYVKEVKLNGNGFIRFEGYGLIVDKDIDYDTVRIEYTDEEDDIDCYSVDKVLTKKQVKIILEDAINYTNDIIGKFKV